MYCRLASDKPVKAFLASHHMSEYITGVLLKISILFNYMNKRNKHCLLDILNYIEKNFQLLEASHQINAYKKQKNYYIFFQILFFIILKFYKIAQINIFRYKEINDKNLY